MAVKSGSGSRPSERSSVERVYRHTREAILSGTYPPGMPLRLHELAAANSVSLIPVREAIRLLEAEQLVETIPNKGARVARLSLDDVKDAYQTRIVLEVEALRRAYGNLTDEDLARARRLKDEMMEHFRKGDDDAGFGLHRQLHFLLYQPSRSKWMLRFIQVLWDHSERYRRLATPLHSNLDEVGEEHVRILDALERRDKQAALRALRQHLHHTSQLLTMVSTEGEETA